MATTATTKPKPKPVEPPATPQRNSIAEWAITILILLFGTSTIAQPFVIPTSSMHNTLLTGDHLYPGRLYISDFPAYVASTERLVRFTETRPVAHILGNHIEQKSTPFADYPVGTVYQPEEHSLELGRANLLELMSALESLHGNPKKLFLRDITIYPREPRAAK